ncbi:toprim domain-containing protein [Singulisphaera sp. Ch08]|uniref:Toprim domain-containing protein n=1 Tax=Singulisphaera sp. Ch08 TaxID=3120278 RepID=A0AAU7CMW2_9BACT
MEYQKTDRGYAGQCPKHRGDLGRFNFEIEELGQPEPSLGGSDHPAGTVLLHCQAYGHVPDGCTQEAVIQSLGLLPRDLFPGAAGGAADWPSLVAQFENAMPLDRLEQLAKALGLPAEALIRFHVGWRAHDKKMEGDRIVKAQCWTIPMRDGQGKITGINRRYANGEKRTMRGGSKGVFLPDGWRELSGPILIPEGFSDAAALVAIGACGFGRPDVGSGEQILAQLLAHDRREVVIVGERDQKPNGSWPGRDGAIELARRLSGSLGRPVRPILPPEGYKDMREFIIATWRAAHAE